MPLEKNKSVRVSTTGRTKTVNHSRKLKDTLSQATKQAQAEFDAKIVKFMSENPEKPHRAVADIFGVHRNYAAKLSRNFLGPRKRGRKAQGATHG